MAEYRDLTDQQARNAEAYPDLGPSIVSHDLQPRRLAAAAQYILPHEHVIDVGCNSGYFKKFCPQAATVFGVDVNPELVLKARSRLDGAIVGAAEDLPVLASSYDVVHLGGVLELVFDPDLVLTEAARVARRAIVGTTAHAAGAWGRRRVPVHEWHVRSFDEDEIVTLLSRYGKLTHLRTIDVNHPPEPQCWVFCVAITG